jgi:hypothetical protein
LHPSIVIRKAHHYVLICHYAATKFPTLKKFSKEYSAGDETEGIMITRKAQKRVRSGIDYASAFSAFMAMHGDSSKWLPKLRAVEEVLGMRFPQSFIIAAGTLTCYLIDQSDVTLGHVLSFLDIPSVMRVSLTSKSLRKRLPELPFLQRLNFYQIRDSARFVQFLASLAPCTTQYLHIKVVTLKYV